MTIDPGLISLAGRVAVVTGGGAGIGRGIAAGMRAFGATVAIWERDAESCAAAADDIGGAGAHRRRARRFGRRCGLGPHHR